MNYSVAAERSVSVQRRVHLPASFPDNAVRQAYLEPTVDESKEPFEWAMPDLEALREYVVVVTLFLSMKFLRVCSYAARNFGWSKSRLDEVLLPVIQKLNSREVASHFFARLLFFMLHLPLGAAYYFRVLSLGPVIGEERNQKPQKQTNATGRFSCSNVFSIGQQRQRRRRETRKKEQIDFFDIPAT